jgi:hypothetical protein
MVGERFLRRFGQHAADAGKAKTHELCINSYLPQGTNNQMAAG